MSSNAISFRATTPTGKLIQPQGRPFWNRSSFRGMTPETMQATLAEAERGETEKLADLALFAYRTDSQIRAVLDTRALAIVGADRIVDPAPGTAAAAEFNKLAADFCAQQLQAHRHIERLISGLIWAEYMGWAVAEHNWLRRDGVWTSEPMPLPSRDLRFGRAWERQLRTYTNGSQGEWIDTASENPARFVWHIPQKIDVPTLDGDFHPVAWPWLFKRWAEVWRQNGMEKGAQPLMYAVVPQNADETVRDNVQSGLENMNVEHTATFYEGTSVQLLESGHMPGEAFEKAIASYNREIAKGILGSDLNTEVGSTGGNRALGESQFSTTILPRLQATAARLASSIEEYWFKPLLRFNAHLFGGVTPAAPTLTFQLINDELPTVDQLALMAGVVTVDELRGSRGLEPWANEIGRAKATIAVPAATGPEPGGRPTLSADPCCDKKEGENRLPFRSTAGPASSAPSSSGYLTRIKHGLSKL